MSPKRTTLTSRTVATIAIAALKKFTDIVKVVLNNISKFQTFILNIVFYRKS